MEPSNDSERLAMLFREYAPRVLAYALRRGLSLEEAEDVVGETFLVAARRFHELTSDPSLWLLNVAGKVTATALRSANRSHILTEKVGNDLACQGAGRGEDGGDPDPVAGAVMAQMADRSLAKALASLSLTEREALLLVAWDGLSVRRAATVARCNYMAFCMRLHRARKKLMSKIGPSGHYVGDGN